LPKTKLSKPIFRALQKTFTEIFMSISILRRTLLLLGLGAVATLTGCGSGGDSAPPAPNITVLSSRADLVAGGSALVEVKWAPGVDMSTAKIAVDDKDVTSSFATRANGRYMGIVSGLKNGTNQLTAIAARSGAKITLTNHPIGGPLLSGPQIQPWICATRTSTAVTVNGNPGATPASSTATTGVSGLNDDPVNAQCDTPPTYRYYYQPAALQGSACTFTITGTNPCFVPYPSLNDPASRPADSEIANFTNDRGDTVKSLIRLEIGSLNRTIYHVVSLYDPLEANTPWAPPKGWNGKLVFELAGGNSNSRFEQPPSTNVFDDKSLRRGFMVAASGLTDASVNVDRMRTAETLMMIKEQVTKKYGEIRYTLGEGCSGGSISQYMTAASYPGVIDGLRVMCSFPDQDTATVMVSDCHLMSNYWTSRNGAALSPSKQAAISGGAFSNCTSWYSLDGAEFPFIASGCSGARGSSFPIDLMASSTNLLGVRCSNADAFVNSVGTFVDTDGITKANQPLDNIGVQYGLKALQSGAITQEEFVQLNEGIGSYNANWVNVPNRVSSSPLIGFTNRYQSGTVANFRNVAKVPIIDMRSREAAGNDLHPVWRTYSVRDRLDRDYGNHDNQVIWGFNGSNGNSLPGAALAVRALETMDAWVAAIKADKTDDALELKVVRNKPAGIKDQCITTLGSTTADIANPIALTDEACPVKIVSIPPRQAAGAPAADNIEKCTLKPLDFSSADYAGVGFTAEQQSRLRAVFPTGICDWAKPGVGQVPSITWPDFSNGPGGVPLSNPPVSTSL
jgi:hypothetical protein